MPMQGPWSPHLVFSIAIFLWKKLRSQYFMSTPRIISQFAVALFWGMGMQISREFFFETFFLKNNFS